MIQPANQANTLYAISGYATPSMVYRHLNDIPNLKLNLIIGMTSREGIGRRIHNAFLDLANNTFVGRLDCRYLHGRHPVHTKAYSWYNNILPSLGFVGSANYTQNAFIGNQGEVLSLESATEIKNYYDSLLGNTVSCLTPNIENYVNLFDEGYYVRRRIDIAAETAVENPIMQRPDLITQTGIDRVTISFLDDHGSLPAKSGLNWGQRDNRERNQAYIRVPADIQRSGFFPPIGEHFAILTDDGQAINCVRAQANGKAIESHENNSIVGAYFRRRMGLQLGSFVRLEDLLRYGRTDVTIHKIDNETYYMDFSI
jgi:hypothetical protein